MLICVEGCIGVGKSTLVEGLAHLVECLPVYEEFDNNPFLYDFYQDPLSYALHVQYTFLLLQERQIRKGLEYSLKGKLAICDFHPIKSKIFANIVLKTEARLLLSRLYDLLFAKNIQPDLIVYLKADENTILSRIKNRNDPYTQGIDPRYIAETCREYDRFFSTYSGNFLVIESTSIDYANKEDNLLYVVDIIRNTLNIAPYFKTRPG